MGGRSEGFKSVSPSVRALGRGQTSLLKNREASLNKLKAAGRRKDKSAKKEAKAENKRRKAAQKIRDKQEAASEKVNLLFSKFSKKNKTGLKDPVALAKAQKKLLSKVKKINTSALTGTAAQDVQRLRDIATTKGPTEAAQALLAEQELGQKSQLEDIESDSALQAQSAFEQLASRGGAGAGSRERQVAQSSRQGLLESQRAKRAGAASRLGIRSEDEGRKLGIAGGLSGQQLGVAGQVQSAQQAQAQIDLAKAGQQAQASQFDQSAIQQAQQFRVGGQSAAILQGQKQGQQFESAQALAAAQRAAANKKQPGMFDKFQGPVGKAVFSQFPGQ